MRIVGSIARDLYNIIPENTEDKFSCLKQKIKKDIILSIPHSSPEMLKSSWFWNKLSSFANEYISTHDYNTIPWCKTFINILQDPDYKKNDPNYHIDLL